MADVLTVVAKIRAAKGKGDALAAVLKEQGGGGAPRRSRAASSIARTAPRRIPISSSSTSSIQGRRPPSICTARPPHLAAYRERREKEGLTQGQAEVEIYRSLTD